jgi:hypothetical protein
MEEEMAFAIYKGEKNIAELAARLFQPHGSGSRAALKQASAALLKANPQLNDVSQIPIGSVIVVPADAPPLQSGQSPAPASLVRAFAAERTQQLLDSLDNRLSYLDAKASGATNAILALAKTKEAQTAAANSPTLKANLPAIVKSSETRLKGLKDGQDSRAKVIAEVRAGLAQFMGSS